ACRSRGGRIVHRPRNRAHCIGVPFFYRIVPMLTSQALASVENLLSQMRAVARESQGLSVQPAVSSGSQGGFAAELANSLNRVSHAQNAANAQAKAFEMGDP